MHSGAVRALICDDEPLARERVRDILSQEPRIDIVGECVDVEQTSRALGVNEVDLLLLDIRMPDATGFELLERLNAENPPLVIFVTAYEEHAAKAFDAHAVDYVLKPIREERLRRALAKAIRLIDVDASRSWAARQPPYPDRLMVSTKESIRFVRVDEIRWIESCGNYVLLHTGEETYMSRNTISRLENQLDPRRFARVHRRVLVSLDAISEIRPMFAGESVAILRSGEELPVSRRYGRRLFSSYKDTDG